MIQALLLDAAGTLIEPLEPVADVYSRAAQSHGLSLEPSTIRNVFRRVFSGLPDPDWAAHPAGGDDAERAWWRQVVGRTLEQAAATPLPQEMKDSCFRDLFAHYEAPEAWLVFPEVTSLLATVRQRGWKCAVVSNFDRRLHTILAGHGLIFDAVITSADARCRKPGPAIFLHALDLLGVPATEAIHAGDSPEADAEGAAALGIPCYLLDRPHRDLSGLIAFAESL